MAEQKEGITGEAVPEAAAKQAEAVKEPSAGKSKSAAAKKASAKATSAPKEGEKQVFYRITDDLPVHLL